MQGNLLWDQEKIKLQIITRFIKTLRLAKLINSIRILVFSLHYFLSSKRLARVLQLRLE